LAVSYKSSKLLGHEAAGAVKYPSKAKSSIWLPQQKQIKELAAP